MKKTIKLTTLAIFTLLSINSYGAQVQWTISGLASRVLLGYDGTATTSPTVYLILADSTSISTITGLSGDNSADFFAALAGITITSATGTTDGKKPAIDKARYDSDKLSSGVSQLFGMVFVDTDTNGDVYYKYITQTATPYTYNPDDASGEATGGITTSWADLNSATTWNKGYTIVPEPATAMLALAGVALLIRRRK